ncbi:MAG TPA: cyclase family protein [Propionibacteriaceae bacterium]
MTDALLRAVQDGVTIHDLGRPYFQGMPQSPNHPAYWRALPRRHGDSVRDDGGSAANDLIFLGTHVGTHIDALAHVSHNGKLYGGEDAVDAGCGGGYERLGVHTIEPMVRRGILLDVPRAHGKEVLEAAHKITVEELETTLAAQTTEIRNGDVVLIRSGWGRKFAEGAPYVGGASGVPGISEAGAEWLAERNIIAAGADTIAFEWLPAGAGHSSLPAHRVLLVENGIYIIEALDLEGLSDAGAHEFTFIMSPLNFTGATGSPVRPLAVVSHV